jgi:hypothetical protein
VLEDHGHPVDAEKCGFSTPLTTKATFPKMWSSESCKPCQYTPSGGDTGELWIYIPLQNGDIFEMPSGNSTETPSDLSDLLLQDVESASLRHRIESKMPSVGSEACSLALDLNLMSQKSFPRSGVAISQTSRYGKLGRRYLYAENWIR